MNMMGNNHRWHEWIWWQVSISSWFQKLMVFSSNPPGGPLLQAWCTVVDYAGNIRHHYAIGATFLHLRSVANSDNQNMGICTHFALCARELASGTKAALNTDNVPQKANFAACSGMRCRLYARALALAPREAGDLPCRFRGIFCRAVCTRFSVCSQFLRLLKVCGSRRIHNPACQRLFRGSLKLVSLDWCARQPYDLFCLREHFALICEGTTTTWSAKKFTTARHG